MRLFDCLLVGLALLALPILFWWGIYQSPQSAVNLQARLDAQAREALRAGGFDWAQVDMVGQRAILRGEAPSEEAITQAAQALLQSSGPGGVVFGGVTLVENRAEPALAVSPYVWRAEKSGEGLFVLEGHAPTQSIRTHLVDEARLVGRSAVDDRMKVAVGAPAGNFQGVARLALMQLARLDAGTAELTDHYIVLKGTSADPVVRTQVRAAMSAVAAPFTGVALIDEATGWRAVLGPEGLVLSGAVRSEAEREDVLAYAAQHYAGPITDQMVTDPQLPEGWVAGVLVALQDFLRFDAGEMAFDPYGGVFTFEGQASPSVLYFLKETMTRSAGRWPGIYGVSPSVDAVRGDESGEAQVQAEMVGEGATASCQARLETVLAANRIGFAANGAQFSRESAAALDQLASIAGRCDAASRFEIRASSAVQAAELADFLALSGIARMRLAAMGGIVQENAGSAAGSAERDPEEAITLMIRVMERSEK